MSDQFDLVVVGAGASGLLAAVAARRLGHRVLVVEADELAGGSTAGSGGELWLPANHLSGKVGIRDSFADARLYLDAVLGEPTMASTEPRRVAYLRTAGKLARWLTSSNIALAPVPGRPDHFPDRPGGKPQGRVLAAQPMDRGILGEWNDRMRPTPAAGGGLGRILGGRRQTTATPGEALAAHLLHRAAANGVEIWLGSPVIELLTEGDAVTGVVADRDGVPVAVGGRVVLLASGGFEHNQNLREEYLPLPTDRAWTTTAGANDGSMLELAVALGAATAGLEDAWWQPVLLAEGAAHEVEQARGKPHSLVVDAAGDRFCNEAAPAPVVGRAMYDRSRGVRAVPAFLILDNRHRRQLPLGPWPAGITPRAALEAGEVVRANTLNDLAQAIGVDRAGLLGTVVRFNGFASKGRDQDFRRGESAWDAAMGEGGKRRNRSLGKVDKPPFWAVRLYPGDAGTKGGLLVNHQTQVLREDGSPLPGLHACGAAAASVFGTASPGPGAALAAGLVEAFILATGLGSSLID